MPVSDKALRVLGTILVIIAVIVASLAIIFLTINSQAREVPTAFFIPCKDLSDDDSNPRKVMTKEEALKLRESWHALGDPACQYVTLGLAADQNGLPDRILRLYSVWPRS